jgi:hypothetical protein
MELTLLRCRWHRDDSSVERWICLCCRRCCSICTKGIFEDDALVVSLALTLRLDAISTCRSFLAAFYSPSPTSFTMYLVMIHLTRLQTHSLRHPVFVLFLDSRACADLIPDSGSSSANPASGVIWISSARPSSSMAGNVLLSQRLCFQELEILD